MGIPKPGDPWGPGRFTAGHPDKIAHDRRYPKPSPQWTPKVWAPWTPPRHVADPLTPAPGGAAKSGGSLLGALAAIVVLVLVFAHQVSVAAVIGIFVLLGAAFFFRKALLALAVVGGMGFGLYAIYQVLK
jgi:hypothetical protein